MDELVENTEHNTNDHGGYNLQSELLVKQKYGSFKEEISHYRFIDMAAYEERIVCMEI